jgi:hypothetical protein
MTRITTFVGWKSWMKRILASKFRLSAVASGRLRWEFGESAVSHVMASLYLSLLVPLPLRLTSSPPTFLETLDLHLVCFLSSSLSQNGFVLG